MLKSRWLPLALFLLLGLLTAGLGGLAALSSANPWYAGLVKPAWTPPTWLFGTAWTALHLGTAAIVWRVWRDGSPVEARHTLRLYVAQLGLNALWSILFLVLHRSGWAVIGSLALWLVAIRLLARLREFGRPALWLWSIYQAWLTVVVLFTSAIWDLNR